MDFEQEILAIHERNRKVAGDKARETSRTRRCVIALLTYIIVVLFFLETGLSQPFLSALVPTGGFLLSTLSLERIKKKRMSIYLMKKYLDE